MSSETTARQRLINVLDAAMQDAFDTGDDHDAEYLATWRWYRDAGEAMYEALRAIRIISADDAVRIGAALAKAELSDD